MKGANPCGKTHRSLNSLSLSYPPVRELCNIVKQYSCYHNIEILIIYVGHNNTDSGNSGFETANISIESASEII